MSFWKGRKVLVIGAHGFTGGYLCRELIAQGAKVRGLVRYTSDPIPDIENFMGNMNDLESVTEAKRDMEIIFNPAAIVSVDEVKNKPQHAFQNNAIGPFNIAYDLGERRLLHISTCHIYGNPMELPIKETTVPNPCDFYGASKYAAEIFLRPLINDGANIVISRSFAKYGPGKSHGYLIPSIITQLIKSEKPKLGNPLPTRDYVYITDVVKGYLLLAEKGVKGEIYNLSSGIETSVKEVYDIICKILWKDVEPIWGSYQRPNDLMRLFGDSTKARSLGWLPKFSLEEGLRETVYWWMKQ